MGVNGTLQIPVLWGVVPRHWVSGSEHYKATMCVCLQESISARRTDDFFVVWLSCEDEYPLFLWNVRNPPHSVTSPKTQILSSTAVRTLYILIWFLLITCAFIVYCTITVGKDITVQA